MTRDGLRIQIVDEQNRPMFDSGSAVVNPICATCCARSAGAGRRAQPADAGRPHRRHPLSGGGLGYSNWELSDRANASRALIAGGLGENRILRVQGWPPASCSTPRTRTTRPTAASRSS
jgi:chemotaxis protein MotB